MTVATASTLVRTFGIVAPTLTILQCLAQADRIRKTGAGGVSLATWLLSCFVSMIWFGYGIVFHVTAEVVANVAAFIVSGVVAYLAAKAQDKLASSLLSFFAATIVTVAASGVGTVHSLRWVLATVAVSSTIIIYLPQLFLVIRPKDLSGVSVISWLIASFTSAGWFVYGFMIHQPALSLPSFVMLPSAVIIFVQVLRHQVPNDPDTGIQAPLVE
jgi:uncharacterized protein with PQ loop repeat